MQLVARGSYTRRDALIGGGSLLAIAALLLALHPAAHRASAAEATTAAKVQFHTITYRITKPNTAERLVTRCPHKKTPLGGGMSTAPNPRPDGEGVYPHSYERLGAQKGWHITVVLFDPTPDRTQEYNVTMQVACGKKPGRGGSKHDIENVRPGQTQTAIAKCKGRSHLFGGGFQRMYFDNRGGVFVTESRAISSKAWRVTGRGFGQFATEMVAIAYCAKGRKRLTEISSSTQLGIGSFGTATTPPCPGGRKLTVGGFSTFPAGSTLMTDGSINSNGTWSTSGFNFFGPASTLTAYGYCFR